MPPDLWPLLALAVTTLACAPAGSFCERELALNREECAILQATALPATLPPARGNLHGDDQQAAALGFLIFFDARFSSDHLMRCATCHMTERNFQDSRSQPLARTPVFRKTPSLLNAARFTWLFWDGSADSLWSQAITPMQNPKEMNLTVLEIAHLIPALFKARYEGVFGPLPDLSDTQRFPTRGGPGMPEWGAMTDADRLTVDRVLANVGKSLEAYLRNLAAGPSAVDRFLAGDAAALQSGQKQGLRELVRAGCLGCHSGSNWSDGSFHNLGVPEPDGAAPDRGRAGAFATLLANRFNSQGPHWDGSRPNTTGPDYAQTSALEGAFKTPSLRNLPRAAPYGHQGGFATLEDVVAFHLAGGGKGRTGFVGEVDAALQSHELSADRFAALIEALKALQGDYPKPPWNDWPQH